MATQADVKTERWAIAMNDWPSFDIVPAKAGAEMHSDERLNGVYSSRLDAIERVIADFEETRGRLGGQIARAKRMRRRELAQGTEAQRAETENTGSVHDGPVTK